MTMTSSALLNVLCFTLRLALRNYMLMLTLRFQGYHISFLQALCHDITFGLLVFTPKRAIYELRLSEFDARISPSGYWLSPRRNHIWGFGYSCVMQDSPSGYWFSPRTKLSFMWNGYGGVSLRFIWPSVLLNCSQLMEFISDNSGTHPK